MTSKPYSVGGRTRDVARGTRFYEPGYIGPVWRIISGVFQLENRDMQGKAVIHRLHAGDLLGAEIGEFDAYAFRATALTNARVVQVPAIAI